MGTRELLQRRQVIVRIEAVLFYTRTARGIELGRQQNHQSTKRPKPDCVKLVHLINLLFRWVQHSLARDFAFKVSLYCNSVPVVSKQ